jgi:hypothetical protein
MQWTDAGLFCRGRMVGDRMSYPETVKLKNAVNDQDHVAGPASAAVTLLVGALAHHKDHGRAIASLGNESRTHLLGKMILSV